MMLRSCQFLTVNVALNGREPNQSSWQLLALTKNGSLLADLRKGREGVGEPD